MSATTTTTTTRAEEIARVQLRVASLERERDHWQGEAARLAAEIARLHAELEHVLRGGRR